LKEYSVVLFTAGACLWCCYRADQEAECISIARGGKGAKPSHVYRVQTRQAFYNTFIIVQSGSNLQTAERNPAHLMAKQTAVVLLLAAAALSIAAAEVTVTQLSTGFEGDRRPAGASQAALKTASASLAGQMCNQHCSHPT
jgi:hypothetical protein